MTVHGPALLFYVFAAIAVAGAVAVVTMRNPMYGAIGLLTTFLAIAALFLLRHAEFLAVVQTFVYGGGIMVLFLFVIMLVNLHRLHEVRLFGRGAAVGLLVAGLLVLFFAFIYANVPFAAAEASASFVEVDGVAMGNTQAVGWKLYTEYLLPFEIASVFLLVAMIGAVVLGRKA